MRLTKDQLENRYLFRPALPQDRGRIAEIEQVCFPPETALAPDVMRRRATLLPDAFLIAAVRPEEAQPRMEGESPAAQASEEDKTLAGYLTWIATDEDRFRDAFFEDPTLHQPDGRNLMLLGLEVLPAYRHQGLAGELLHRVIARAREEGRCKLVLTCEEDKIEMYKKFGFRLLSVSASKLGGVTWYEMELPLTGR